MEWSFINIEVIKPYSLGIIFVIIYVAEHIFPQRKELIDHKHDFKNILYGLINLTIVTFGGLYFQNLIEYTNKENWGILQLFNLPSWSDLIIGFLVIDFFMYWWHRFNHEIPFFWYFHQFHHKDQKMNSTSAVRFHIGELILSYIVRIIIFPLLGLSIASIILHGFILFPVIVFHHSNLKISLRKDLRLRKIIVTPLMHRIHHSNIRKETDSNYGSILPFWDMIFRSYIKKSDKPVEFGI